MKEERKIKKNYIIVKIAFFEGVKDCRSRPRVGGNSGDTHLHHQMCGSGQRAFYLAGSLTRLMGQKENRLAGKFDFDGTSGFNRLSFERKVILVT